MGWLWADAYREPSQALVPAAEEPLPRSCTLHPRLQATVKRGGDYTGGVRGEVSFNGDLGEPCLGWIFLGCDSAVSC
jgi:hypothetical protein